MSITASPRIEPGLPSQALVPFTKSLLAWSLLPACLPSLSFITRHFLYRLFLSVPSFSSLLPKHLPRQNLCEFPVHEGGLTVHEHVDHPFG